jgi:hypothetical protein
VSRAQIRRAAGSCGGIIPFAADASGEKGVAPGGAALLCVVVHEDRAFVADAVDIRRFADHQASMVYRRLHPAMSSPMMNRCWASAAARGRETREIAEQDHRD